MKFWVAVSSFIILVYSSHVFAFAPRCEGLFSLPTIPEQIVNKIDKTAEIKYNNFYSFVPNSLPLTEAGKKTGYEFLKNYRYFASQQLQRPYSEKEILEYGDHVYAQAIEFLKTTKIKYKIQKIEVGNEKRNMIVISTEGKHSLNVEAKEFLQNTGTELAYSPHKLLSAISDALFYFEENRLIISAEMLVEGSVRKNPSGRHEIVHIFTNLFYANNIPYLFHGLTTTAGQLPGVSGAYKESLAFDELLAHLAQTSGVIQLITRENKILKTYSRNDRISLTGVYRADLKTALDNGKTIASSSYQIATAGLNLVKSNPNAVKFVRKGNYYHASWTIKGEKSIDDYVTEIPLLTFEKLSREELLERLEVTLQQQKMIALYYRNLFKVGSELAHKTRNAEHAELADAFKKYQKLIDKKYSFSSHSDVPTQKELIESLKK